MSAALSRRSVTLTLYQGDDFERLADLRRRAEYAAQRAEQAAETVAARAGDDEPDPETAEAVRRAQAEYDAFVDEAAERATEVRLRAIPRKAFRRLMAEHEPRTGNEEDARYEVNTETFPEALLLQSIEEPRFTADERQDFIDDLAEGEFERHWLAAYWLNRAPGGDPKASRYSAGSQSSTVT